ncbi:MAG: hypothetical protein ACTSU5_15425 [Promethearchaeota archaeon]
MQCPKCGSANLTQLTGNIYECGDCKRIITLKDEKEEESVGTKEGEFTDGAVFHEEASLSKKWEICEKGITILKEKTRWIAVLICHPPDEQNFHYVRLSWWKKSFYEHGGMFKVFDKPVLANLIKALEMIDENFGESFEFTGKFTREIDGGDNPSSQAISKKLCPNPRCGARLKKDRGGRFLECERCGEIVVIEDGNPIFNVPSDEIELEFSSNFPINYYLPEAGIMIKNFMAEKKAVVVIFSPENPEKKFLRFYWWNRNLQEYLQGSGPVGGSSDLGWSVKRGVLSPNIYRRELVPKLVSALKKIKQELKW